jgi:hypothetical protein
MVPEAWLEAAIGADNEVVIAHSLGSVVADETSFWHPEWEVNGRMTKGSPLGEELILDLFDSAASDDRAVPQQSDHRWDGRCDAVHLNLTEVLAVQPLSSSNRLLRLTGSGRSSMTSDNGRRHGCNLPDLG